MFGMQLHPISPLEPILSFTASTFGTNISIHNFFHFLLLPIEVYEKPQQKVLLFNSIFSFVLILQRIKNKTKQKTTTPTPKFDMQKNPNQVLKRPEVSEKLKSVFQEGSLSQYNTPFPFFFKVANCVENKKQES